MISNQQSHIVTAVDSGPVQGLESYTGGEGHKQKEAVATSPITARYHSGWDIHFDQGARVISRKAKQANSSGNVTTTKMSFNLWRDGL